MSTPAHIWFTDENNAPVLGECLMPTRLGSNELKSFNHSVWMLYVQAKHSNLH
ncbi:hypothetical protein EAI6_17330 [Enterobacter asburiae]|nr:hypothetical protein EAI6_17330 [Enterobacter asburiae]